MLSSSFSDIRVNAVSAPAVEQSGFFLPPHDQFQPHDAKGSFVKGSDFYELYCEARDKVFNENDEHFLCFCKNMRIHQIGVYANYCAHGVELVGHVNEPTLWDAYICKVRGVGHVTAVFEIGWQLGNYAKAISEYFPPIACGGGQEVFSVQDANGNPVRKATCPDCLIRDSIGHQPCLLVELEVHNRDPLELSKHVVQLLQAINTLRSAIGVKVYPRTGNGDGGPFAAVCFVWKKRPDNTIYVDRVFDFGTRPSNCWEITSVRCKIDTCCTKTYIEK